MIAAEVKEQIKPFVKASLLQTKIPAKNFIIPLDLPINFWQSTHLESRFDTAIDLFTNNADFISHSLDVMDDSFLF